MKVITFIISIFFSIRSSGQNNLIFLFDFDSTKIYLKYVDLKPYIKKQNVKVNEISKLSIKNDTIKLDGYYLQSGQRLDSLSFSLDKEMFSTIDNKKANIIFQGKKISVFYTEKIKNNRNHKRYFTGVYYFDGTTKKHFFTKTIFQKRNCSLYR